MQPCSAVRSLPASIHTCCSAISPNSFPPLMLQLYGAQPGKKDSAVQSRSRAGHRSARPYTTNAPVFVVGHWLDAQTGAKYGQAMSQPPLSGSIGAGHDMVAHTINTGREISMSRQGVSLPGQIRVDMATDPGDHGREACAIA